MTLSPFGSTRTISKLGATASPAAAGAGAGAAAGDVGAAGVGAEGAAAGSGAAACWAGLGEAGGAGVPADGLCVPGCDIVTGAVSEVDGPNRLSQLRTPSRTTTTAIAAAPMMTIFPETGLSIAMTPFLEPALSCI
jgi:hypothetical protein